MKFLPHKLILNNYVRYVLKEDLTYNDITTELIVDDDKTVEVVINYRQEGIVCGLPFAQEVYSILDSSVELEILEPCGKKVKAGTDVAIIKGPAKPILTGERTVLNLLQKASGIATITRSYVDKLEGSNTKLTDTRKTTPGNRILEKYSIRVGGAFPHRYNLSDCILIKDNHIALAGSITEAVKRVKQHCSHTTKIEVETENEDQVKEALEAIVDIIMLDNMPPEQIKIMVEIINKKATTEASGNINFDNIAAYAQTGVDYISTSNITAKAPILDIGMDIRPGIIYL